MTGGPVAEDEHSGGALQPEIDRYRGARCPNRDVNEKLVAVIAIGDRDPHFAAFDEQRQPQTLCV